jgi:hypothetical protein
MSTKGGRPKEAAGGANETRARGIECRGVSFELDGPSFVLFMMTIILLAEPAPCSRDPMFLRAPPRGWLGRF